ncbi:hypothetical protein ACFFUT_12415 [Pseudohalocynthiibacter aestuariivivens]|uniref:Uncharacterized protein n=1 Tax=Pseudohalocynthiibacter aestuariivivens TaxID=1591409 RepID=A0ABV5JGI7_9RHOB|nr:hypothetical protein [Pseudohalocynthiibacter aestuariivivens]MBS9718974.1 hypothetical protein [Pseudohalocynthiibacter aestuariivivens]
MSAHSTKARNRHPNPKSYEREKFAVTYVIVEVCDHPENGQTFALIAGEFPADGVRPLFTGHIEQGMATLLICVEN